MLLFLACFLDKEVCEFIILSTNVIIIYKGLEWVLCYGKEGSSIHFFVHDVTFLCGSLKYLLFSPGDRKSKLLDDDSDRASETSSGSRSRKINGKSKGKNKSNKKKIDVADEDSDTSQTSGKTKKKAGKSKGKREKVVINKKRKKERKKRAGELLSLSAIAFKSFVY